MYYINYLEEGEDQGVVKGCHHSRREDSEFLESLNQEEDGFIYIEIDKEIYEKMLKDSPTNYMYQDGEIVEI